MLLTNFRNTTGEQMTKIRFNVANLAWNDIKADDAISESEQRSKSSGKKLIHEANAVHLLEDLHHETVTHARHLRRSTFLWVLHTVNGVTHGQDWRQLLGAGYFHLSAERRGDGKRPRRGGSGYRGQNQGAEGNRRRWSKPVEGPALAPQWTVPLQKESWREQPGQRSQRPGPEHPHPEERHDEVHGGTGLPAMLGSLGQFAPIVKSSKQRTTSFPSSHWAVT